MSSGNEQIQSLLAIMRNLRDPEHGCPWDIEQTFETIAPCTIEEAYEVDDAIRAGDMSSLKDELGDLLFQIVFHAQIASEAGHFDFDDVVRAVCDKMIRRHPHVFAGADIADADAQRDAWEQHKEAERLQDTQSPDQDTRTREPGALDGVSKNLPALLRAVKLQKRAARVGFDWPETLMVLDKIREESLELTEEIANLKTDATAEARIKEEFGDLLFVHANLARHLDVNPETALRSANAKFERRFRRIEALLGLQGRTPRQSNLEEMDALWDQVKREEKAS